MSVTLLKFDDQTGDIAPVTATDTIEAGQIQLDGVGGIALNAGGHLLSNLSDPMAQYDAATKGYVDSVVQSYAQGGYAGDGTTGSGAAGPAGKSILSGTGAPDNSTGNVGDLYIQLDAGPYLWQAKATNGWPNNPILLRGPQGDRGVAGVPGYSIRPSQSDPPANTLGNNGDYALTSAGVLYGPKASGVYASSGLSLIGPAGQSITGPQGAAGQSITGPQGPPGPSVTGPKGDAGQSIQGNPGLNGASILYSTVDPPAPSAGAVNDLCITQSGYVYGPKSSSGWASSDFSIVGPKGDSGAASTVPGPAGKDSTVPGPAGPAGKDSTVPGPAGKDSTVPGPQGAGVQTATSDPPSNALGNNGDYALSETTVLYGPKNAGAWPSKGTSLVGMMGPQGASVTGPQGTRGASVLYSNNNPPASSLGNNGDFAITFDGALFGPKASGAWGAITLSLIGPQGQAGQSVTGPRGASILTAQADPPDASLGNVGDYAITPDTYLFGPKTSSGWGSGGVLLVGPRGAASTVAGPQGQMGNVGATGAMGVRGASVYKTNSYSSQDNLPTSGYNTGDFLITSDYFIFGPYSQTNGWPATGVSLIGPRGAAGINGATIQTGASTVASNVGNIGDYYFEQDNTTLYGPKTSSGWPSTGTSLKGAQGQSVTGPQGPAGASVTGPAGPSGSAGSQIYSGNGNPPGGTGIAGDYFLSTDQSTLYGPKTSATSWPSSGTYLRGSDGATGPAGQSVTGPAGPTGSAGASGSQIYSGTGNPPSGTGVVGDYFLSTDQVTLYGPKTSATAWPSSGLLLKGTAGAAGATGPSGASGAAGSQIYSGTGTPPSGTGTTGDYFFATDTYTLYGPKTSATAWASSGTVLRGATGSMGTAGASGSNGNTIRNGANAPTSSTTGVAGDFYLATATSTLYGPATGANAWPSTGTSLIGASGSAGAAGNTVRNGSAAPTSSTTGVAGDFYIATSSPYTIYGPATGTNAWPSTGTSLVGPAGPSGSGSGSSTASTVGSSGLTFNDGTVQNTAFPGAIALSQNTATCGPATWYNGGSLTSTAVVMQTVGGTTTQYFQPPTASGFYGCVGVNYTTSNAAIYIQLYNSTDSVAIWTSPTSLATGSVNNYGPFAIATYPMAANKQYVWRISGSGTTYANVIPQYFVPSNAPYATQYPSPSMIATATTLSSTPYGCRVANNTNMIQYYKFATGGFFTYATFTNYSTTTAVVFTLTSTATVYTSPSVAAGATTTVGPFGPGAYYMAANTNFQWNVTGSGSATVLINWAYVG